MFFYEKLNELIRRNEELVTITIVETSGSTPARDAFKMLVTASGLLEGTVGGGALEYRAVEIAKACLTEKASKLISIDLDEVKMACGGSVKLFFEYIAPQKSLYIFGGGHIAQAIAPPAHDLGFRLTVVDHRPEIQDSPRLSDARSVLSDSYKKAVEDLDFLSPSYALIVSNKHLYDGETLLALLKKDVSFRYIGMIGSRKKVKECFDMLRAEGIPQEKIDKVFAPVGLNLGGNTPMEIAVSILGEIIAVDHGLKPDNMKL